MNVIWTPKASRDLDEAMGYIALDKPDAAVKVVNRIYEHVMDLVKVPNIGRLGIVQGHAS